jgi:2-amino-4-hydroxy-6-hydroxymethyldihydropteridine diphosphokinase
MLQNPPFGYTDQDDFLNAVLAIETTLQPHALMRHLLRVERRFGRVRSFANAPRTLDLDLLFYDRRRIHSPDLVVPHPHWRERESVVIPLLLLPSGRR